MLPLQGNQQTEIRSTLTRQAMTLWDLCCCPMLPSLLMLGSGWVESTVCTRHFSRQFKEEPDLLDSNKEQLLCWISSFCLQVTWPYGMNRNTFLKNLITNLMVQLWEVFLGGGRCFSIKINAENKSIFFFHVCFYYSAVVRLRQQSNQK